MVVKEEWSWVKGACMQMKYVKGRLNIFFKVVFIKETWFVTKMEGFRLPTTQAIQPIRTSQLINSLLCNTLTVATAFSHTLKHSKLVS